MISGSQTVEGTRITMRLAPPVMRLVMEIDGREVGWMATDPHGACISVWGDHVTTRHADGVVSVQGAKVAIHGSPQLARAWLDACRRKESK